MSLSLIIPLVAVLVLAALLVARRSGPRVTQIDRTIRKEKDGDA